ncbi:MAG: radical SAM protein [Candidatus Diapherotrites archaeon]|nr:radical SAM protein [Candidatus Diapherotrites archaeon]
MLVNEVKSKSVLTKTNLPESDYCINPYTGCQHACIYCYADFMKRYSKHEESWGSFVDVKVNAPEVLRKQLRRAKRGSVILSSVTDPYQPLEKKYGITRQCLEALLEKQFPTSILTKSALVTRDTDLFRKFEDVSVGVSVNSLDREWQKKIEPFASPPEERVNALQTIHDAGVPTYAFVSPFFPRITPLEDLAEALHFADDFWVEAYNPRWHWDEVMSAIPAGLAEEYERIFSGKATYFDDVRRELHRLRPDAKLFLHGARR